jgi:DNA-binding beta-propeller fold protein YncE
MAANAHRRAITTGCSTMGFPFARPALLTFGIAALLVACAATPLHQEAAPMRPLVFPAPPDEPRFIYERTVRTSADLIAPEETSALRRLVTGEETRGEPLSKPYAIAATRGRIYVSDTVSRYVRLFDVPRGQFHRIGEEDGPGQLTKPIGVDVDAAGNLYVADIGAKAVFVYGPDRQFLRRIGGDKWFSRLTSVTVDPAGTKRVFDAKSGEHLMDIGKRGSGPGEFNLPRDIAIGVDGRLYVVDGGNFRVVVFDRDGKYLSSFGSVGKQYGQFARPKEIAIDREGNVYVVDSAFGNFQIFNPDGELLLFVGERSERDGPGKYMLPSGIAVDEDGRVYMVDQWFRKIEVFRPVALKAEAGFVPLRSAQAK